MTLPADPASATARRRPPHAGSGAEPAGAALDTPGSVRVSCLLMQDAVAAKAPSVSTPKSGAIDGLVAMFANPYLNGQEEALVISDGGLLTYLRRAATETGWEQVETSVRASEVAVVVHPRDLTVWALCSIVTGVQPGPKLRALRLVADVADGVTTCRWEEAPNAIAHDPADAEVAAFEKLSVSYATGWFCVSAVGVVGNQDRLFGVIPGMDGDVRFRCVAHRIPFAGFFAIDEVTARFPGGSATVTPTFWVRVGDTLYWYNAADGTSRPLPGTKVRRIVGTFPAYKTGSVGAVALDATGALLSVVPYANPENSFKVEVAKDTVFTAATSWLDADGMIHVYGVDATNTLKVVHQKAWGFFGLPAWAQSVGVIEPSKQPVTVTSCVGLVPGASAFVLDPFPDAFPSQLVRTGGVKAPQAEYGFYTQDVNSARWSRDKVRLPVATAPELVTSYVSSATVLDRRGVAMPGLTVRVSAETLTEVQIDGVSHLIGPGRSASVSTNAQGKVVISSPADTLAPAVLHIDAAGLQNGAVIQPAAAAHRYLAGEGTLPSQSGKFSEDVLKAAKVDGVPIVLPGHEGSAKAVVTGARQIFQLADGKTPTSLLGTGNGPAKPLYAFAVGPRPGAKPNEHGVIVSEYQEFYSAETYADYHRQVHGAGTTEVPVEGDGWQDFVKWAGDVWQGIKNGAIAVADFAVEVANGVAAIAIKIGEATVNLTGLIVDTAETAARAVESAFRRVVADIGKVVDWLSSLFAFQDIWQTKKALAEGTKTVMSYGLTVAEHFKTLGDDWVEKKKADAAKYYADLRTDYRNRPLGDARNQLPPLAEASGSTVSPAAVRDDPRSGWLTQQAVSPAALAAFEAHEDSGETPASIASIAAAWDALVFEMVEKGVVADVMALLHDLDALAAAICDPSDPAGPAKSSMMALIDVLESLTELALNSVKTLLSMVIGLVSKVVKALDGLFTEPLPGLGPLEKLYRWIQGQAGVDTDAVEDLTLGGLLMLLAAFPATVGYKLINGVGEGPFPSGTFPTLAEPKFGAEQDPAAAGEDPVLNDELRILQLVCGLSGLAGTAPALVADLLPLMSLTKRQEWLVDLITAVDTTALGALVFGTMGSCPPVTGTDWKAADRTWSVAFELSVITVVANMGTIAVAIRDRNLIVGGDTAVLRNVGDETTGPVLTTLLALGYLVSSGLACEKDKVNAYTTAMILLSGISGVTQIARVGLDGKKPSDAVRGGVIAAVDFAATGVSASMLTAAASLAYAEIDPGQTFAPAKLGQPYSAQVKASGGNHVFNKGLKNWTVADGRLPDGLVLDEASGTISGTPTGTGKATFAVQCSDSNGPPQFSKVTPLTIDVVG